MKTSKEKKLEEFDEKFPFVETELGEDRPLTKIKDIRHFISKALAEQDIEFLKLIDDLKLGKKEIEAEATKAERERNMNILMDFQGEVEEVKGVIASFKQGALHAVLELRKRLK